MKNIALILLCLLLSPTLRAQSDKPAPIQVMILGTYHFANPGLDLHDIKAQSVLTPQRQKELEDIATRLAKFNPTKIAVEALSTQPDLSARSYAEFTPAKLTSDPDESVQIGFRLAQRLGQKTVYGIDEQSKTIDYFPYEKVQAYAKAHGQTAILDQMQASAEAMMKKMEAAQNTTPIRLMLASLNEPARVRSDHDDFYYKLLALGDQKEQAGAELNAAWFQRNAKIFAKLIHVAQPGDRILVVFGSGHAFWLRHLTENMPGFSLVEPNDYLR